MYNGGIKYDKSEVKLMKIKMTVQEFDETVNSIRYKYKLIAPVSIPYAGQYSDTDVIRY